MTQHAPTKPVGGVVGVEILPAQGASCSPLASGGGVELSILAGYAFTPLELIEQSSSYTEEALTEQGLTRIRHRLEVMCDPESLRGQTLDQWTRTLSETGVLARVRTASGAALLVGCSLHFGMEQPLRLVASQELTHTASSDAPSLRLVFESEDLSPATTY